MTNTGCWRFCHGCENSADHPYRSCQGRKLGYNQLWWQDLEFLRKLPEVWPDILTKYNPVDAHEEQIRNPPKIVHSLLILTPTMSSVDLKARKVQF